MKIKTSTLSSMLIILSFLATTSFAGETFENYEKYKNVFTNSNSKVTVLIHQDFESTLAGKYSQIQLNQDFLNPVWSQGIIDGRASIIQDSEPGRGKVLRVLYPAHGVDSKGSGVSWRTPLPGSFQKLNLSYRVKFEKGFSFVKGGKLPGLLGGLESSGLRKSDGNTGFSARMMWYENGRVTSYVYHTDQMDNHGDIMDWTEDGINIHFKSDVWYSIEQQVVMNTPGQRDGQIYGWIDGKLVFKKRHINFRNTAKYAIDSLFFSTFFGGHTKDFESPRDQFAYFDDIIVSQESIWNSLPK